MDYERLVIEQKDFSIFVAVLDPDLRTLKLTSTFPLHVLNQEPDELSRGLLYILDLDLRLDAEEDAVHTAGL